MPRKLGYVEGMRGVAALIVCLSHYLQIFLPAVYEGEAAKSWGVGERVFETSPANVLLNPNFAVCLFFVLSGYVLGHGFLATGDPERIWFAAVKRFPRLMLPVLGSVLFTWGLLTAGAFHYGDVRPLTGAIMPDYFAVPRSFCYAVAEGSFGTFFAGDISLNPVLWTIRIEFFGSFLVFFLLAVFRRRRDRWLGYGAAAIFLYDSYYLAFPLGLALASLPAPPAGRRWVAAVLAVIGLALGSYPYFGAEHGFWRFLPTPGDALPIVFHHSLGAVCLLAATHFAPPGVRAGFDRAVFRFLGRVSYGLYLIHFAVLAALPTWLVLLLAPAVGYLPAVALAFVPTLPAVLAAAYGFAWAVDEPATRFAGRLAERILAGLRAMRRGPADIAAAGRLK
jgi:peptidoglycan/LPS O-acetylase OafA/YrhL